MTEIPSPLIEHLEAILRSGGVAAAAEEAVTIANAARGTNSDIATRAIELARQRASGQPLAYVTGRTRFMGLELLTAAGALIPREETELLANTVLGRLEAIPGDRPVRVIDMCCGSGNLACAIAAHCGRSRVWASDLTHAAVEIARANVTQLGLTDRVTVVEGDLFSPLADAGLSGTIDLVMCNPPYISSGKLAKDSAVLLEHEPREAFDGGPYGVSIFQRVIRDAAAFLHPDGQLLFEIGAGQERQITALFTRAQIYDAITTYRDPAGEGRVVGAVRR